MRKSIIVVFLVLLTIVSGTTLAQTDIAAVMTVDVAPVEVQRVGTDQWLPVNLEAIVGVGDQIRTGETGQATITFFADAVETVLEPGTTYRIDVFNGDADTFNLSVSVLAGQTQQRINRALDAGSNYDVDTPGATLVARGTIFNVRVEESGRSAMIVTEGEVEADADGDVAMVAPQFGVRADAGGELSDVVAATTFAGLDAALDGCTATVTTVDDVRLNVRLGPDQDFDRVGTIAAEDITNIKGETTSGNWYRIDFRGGFGWVLASNTVVDSACPGLRQFPLEPTAEDPSLYEFIGDPIELDSAPAAPEEATESDS